MERLSSGVRVNSASDDAAGLGVANKIKSDLRGIKMATRNTSDGISLIQTADAVMAEITNMVIRMRELTVQMNNGVYREQDRANAQLEIEELKTEIKKILENSEFNQVKLFDRLEDITLRVGNLNSEKMNVKIDDIFIEEEPKILNKLSISNLTTSSAINETITEDIQIEIPSTFAENKIDKLFYDVGSAKAITVLEASEASSVTISSAQLGITPLVDTLGGRFSLRGVDANKFDIGVTTGEIISVGTLDFENPTGSTSGRENFYRFDVLYSTDDGEVLVDQITLNILDIEETLPTVSAAKKVSSNIILSHGESIVSKAASSFALSDQPSLVMNLDDFDLMKAFTREYQGGDFTLSGDDARLFSLNHKNSVLSFPAFSSASPIDTNRDNVYEFFINYVVDDKEFVQKVSFKVNPFDTPGSKITPTSTMVYQKATGTNIHYDITEALSLEIDAHSKVAEREYLSEFIANNPNGFYRLSGRDADAFSVLQDGRIKSKVRIDYKKQSNYEFTLTYQVADKTFEEFFNINVLEPPFDSRTKIDDLSIETVEKTLDAIATLDETIHDLSASRAELGALENRLNYNLSYLTKAAALTELAGGRIIDADFAKETSALIKNQILNQSSMEMLSQANQNTQNILKLIL